MKYKLRVALFLATFFMIKKGFTLESVHSEDDPFTCYFV